jgi:hypothetical protein
MQNPTTMTPAEIDAIWLPLMERIAAERQHVADYLALVRDAASYEVARLTTKLDEFRARRDAAKREAVPFENEWDRRGGWTRYYLVKNGDGHFHRDTNCSTCFPTTVFGILPQTSGLDDNELVALVGMDACTVCFPSAPASQAWRDGVSHSKSEKDARRDAATAARIEKADKKVAYWEKALARLSTKMVKAGGDPDFTGEPVDVFLTIRDRDGYHTDQAESDRYYIGCALKSARESLRYARQDRETAGEPVRQRVGR